jgi:hypothetical protein
VSAARGWHAACDCSGCGCGSLQGTAGSDEWLPCACAATATIAADTRVAPKGGTLKAKGYEQVCVPAAFAWKPAAGVLCQAQQQPAWLHWQSSDAPAWPQVCAAGQYLTSLTGWCRFTGKYDVDAGSDVHSMTGASTSGGAANTGLSDEHLNSSSFEGTGAGHYSVASLNGRPPAAAP